MSKIIKHTFIIPSLEVINGELKETGNKQETYTFTYLFKGLGVYEEITNKPLINDLMDLSKLKSEDAVKKIMGTKFLLDLASASYVKIDDNGAFHNNRATCEEFKKKEVASHLNDVNFITSLLTMAIECLVGKEVKLEQGKKVDTDIKEEVNSKN